MRGMARALASCGVVLLGGALLAGCGSWFGYDKPTTEKTEEQKKRDEKTREEVAKAVENAKPTIKEAGRKLGEAARTAADSAQAAVEGVKEGWQRGKDAPVDLNSASESELTRLPGITPRDARKIIAGRPYKDAHELVRRRLVSEEEYSRIQDAVTAK
jgi:DNA uptake protein ComE-like DNA-binding protein